MLNLDQIRAETPNCKEKIHLNNAGASLQPITVLESVNAYLDLESRIGGYEAATLVSTEAAAFYELLAKMLHTNARNIAFTTNATQGYNKALSSIPLDSGDVILTTNDDYIANQVAFLWLKKYRGVEIMRAELSKSGGVDISSIEYLIKKYQPKLVAITHVPSNSGLVQPVYAIGELCKKYDILYLVDACQSAGQLEIDVNKMNCDFLSATFRKWMRGPRGVGFLFVSNKALNLDLEPMFPDGNSATWTNDFSYQLTDDAKRFEYWERSYANLMGAKNAVAYALKIGIGNIQTRVKMLASHTRTQIMTIDDFDVLDKGDELCGIVTAHAARRDWRILKHALLSNNFNISILQPSNALLDFRAKGVEWMLRIAPHYYNTKEEIDKLVDFLRRC